MRVPASSISRQKKKNLTPALLIQHGREDWQLEIDHDFDGSKILILLYSICISCCMIEYTVLAVETGLAGPPCHRSQQAHNKNYFG